jgi:uncharacterized protein with HEPN domain
MSTLSQAIHGDVVDLGERTKRLQTHADRESRNTIPWNERREKKNLIQGQRSYNIDYRDGWEFQTRLLTTMRRSRSATPRPDCGC